MIISSFSFCQVTGLNGWNIFIDPGHSQTENMGVNGYSEAEEVLRVGLQLQDILLNQTDIDTAYISRTNDQQQVPLYQRTNQAIKLSHKNLFIKTSKALFIIIFLPALVLVFFGPQLFNYVFGSEWTEAGVFAQIFIFYYF